MVSSRDYNLLGYVSFVKTFLEYQCSLQFLPAPRNILKSVETLREFFLLRYLLKQLDLCKS